jgi:hypothetical protein
MVVIFCGRLGQRCGRRPHFRKIISAPKSGDTWQMRAGFDLHDGVMTAIADAISHSLITGTRVALIH